MLRKQKVLSTGLCAILSILMVETVAAWQAKSVVSLSTDTSDQGTSLQANFSVSSQQLARLADAYPLGAGDVISISIFNVPEYSGSQQVLADGSVNLPAIGRVDINGLTPEQAESTIAIAYQNELRYPQITVVLEDPRPLRKSV